MANKEELRASRTFGLTSSLLTFFIAGIIFFIGGKLYDFLDSHNWIVCIEDQIKRPLAAPLITLIIYEIGIGLFRFRQNQQYWYGIAEVIFALMSCTFFAISLQAAIINGTSTIPLWFACSASMYLVVRGGTNIQDGMDKEYKFRKQIEAFNRFASPNE